MGIAGNSRGKGTAAAHERVPSVRLVAASLVVCGCVPVLETGVAHLGCRTVDEDIYL